MSNKILIILLVVVAILAAGGYFYWSKFLKTAPSATEQAVEDIQKTVDSINENLTQGVLPAIDAAVNPMENVPNTNPYSNTNPFSGIKVNPFK